MTTRCQAPPQGGKMERDGVVVTGKRQAGGPEHLQVPSYTLSTPLSD